MIFNQLLFMRLKFCTFESFPSNLLAAPAIELAPFCMHDDVAVQGCVLCTNFLSALTKVFHTHCVFVALLSVFYETSRCLDDKSTLVLNNQNE